MSVAQGADIQSRLTIVCQDIVTFFEEAGVDKHSVALLSSKVENLHNVEVMNIAAAYGKSMAFIDHDILHKNMAIAWSLIDDKARNDRNIVVKKINALAGDKSDEAPAKILALKQQFEDIDKRRAVSLVECLKYKYMVTVPMEVFKTEDGNPDMKKIFEEHKEAAYVQCKHVGKGKH
jgi:hypothetical protein